MVWGSPVGVYTHKIELQVRHDFGSYVRFNKLFTSHNGLIFKFNTVGVSVISIISQMQIKTSILILYKMIYCF